MLVWIWSLGNAAVFWSAIVASWSGSGLSGAVSWSVIGVSWTAIGLWRSVEASWIVNVWLGNGFLVSVAVSLSVNAVSSSVNASWRKRAALLLVFHGLGGLGAEIHGIGAVRSSRAHCLCLCRCLWRRLQKSP